MPEPELRIKLPEKLLPILESRHRYIVLYGGRGGAKSWATAITLLLRGYRDRLLILCTREVQNTIKDSVHRLLADTIGRLKLDAFYEIQKDCIIGRNGTRFIFKGLRHNIAEIKSTEGVDICWLEEAQAVSRESWGVLIPTIRREGSQFFVVFNPDQETDPTYKDFIISERENSLVIHVNYWDNPFFHAVLRKEMEWDKKNDYEKYLHVWEGRTRASSDAQVFRGKFTVEAFEAPEDAQFYYGADWGFSQDPTALVRCFVNEKTLLIDYEAYGVGVDIDKTPEMFDAVPGARKSIITADSARPETISYMRKNGFPHIRSAKKGKGSVVDGVTLLRSFEKIIIHPRCQHTIDEFKLYSYKTDRITGEVLPVLEDRNNHCIDALRYSIENIGRTLKASKISLGALGL